MPSDLMAVFISTGGVILTNGGVMTGDGDCCCEDDLGCGGDCTSCGANLSTSISGLSGIFAADFNQINSTIYLWSACTGISWDTAGYPGQPGILLESFINCDETNHWQYIVACTGRSSIMPPNLTAFAAWTGTLRGDGQCPVDVSSVPVVDSTADNWVGTTIAGVYDTSLGPPYTLVDAWGLPIIGFTIS